jgi:hypothetical protein
MYYDVRGDLYKSKVIAVDPVNGTADEARYFVADLNWRNQRGEVMKIQENFTILKKYRYDELEEGLVQP